MVLATLRHEMEHARHLELALAWLVKWRDERTAKPFATWMQSQKIPDDVRAIIGFTYEPTTNMKLHDATPSCSRTSKASSQQPPPCRRLSYP